MNCKLGTNFFFLCWFQGVADLSSVSIIINPAHSLMYVEYGLPKVSHLASIVATISYSPLLELTVKCKFSNRREKDITNKPKMTLLVV